MKKSTSLVKPSQYAVATRIGVASTMVFFLLSSHVGWASCSNSISCIDGGCCTQVEKKKIQKSDVRVVIKPNTKSTPID